MKKIYRNVMAVMALALGALTTACSDWDDHYVADATMQGNANATLWENIQADSQLSQFATLLKKVGFDKNLNASQTFTVWAPLNGTFDFERLMQTANDTLLNEFVENHIARSNFPASGTVADKICLLNEKSMMFQGNGSYTMSDVAVATPNIASKNGVIHTLQGKLPFLPNIYESLNAVHYPIDSIANFFHHYDEKELRPGLSVEGPIVNGEITYLDSVFYENNDLFTRYGWNFINEEDSSYTMIVPTNDAWTKAYNSISKYFNYVSGYKFDDQSLANNDTTVTFDADYLRDSLVRKSIMSNLFYNNNLYDNKALKTFQQGGRLMNDSLTSTYNDLSRYEGIIYNEDANDLFVGATRLERSNGAMWITDTLRQRPWNTFNPIIQVEGESSMTNVSVGYNNNIFVYTSDAQNPAVPGRLSNYGFVEVSNSAANPTFSVYLPEVLSTTYAIYAVFVPSNIINVYDTVPKPNLVNVQISYNTETGDLNGVRPNGARRLTSLARVTTDPTKIDTVFVSDFTFPMAYAGTGRYYPSLVFQGQATGKSYEYPIRLDCVILVPKELDTYIKEHPDYKFYRPNN